MKLRVNVNGQDYNVEVDILEENGPGRTLAAVRTPVAAPPPRAVATAPAPAAAPKPAPAAAPAASSGGKTLNSPIPGTVVEIKVKPGQAVAAGEVVMVIDAMKMNTPIPAQPAGTIKNVLVAVGNPVKMGTPLVEFE